jgi:type III secretory pathway lipoprotein EscJ
MRKRLVWLPLIALFALMGCASQSATSAPAAAPVSNAARAPEMSFNKAYDSADGGTTGSVAPEAEAPQDETAETRLVIRNANLTIVVADPNQAMTNIGRLAESINGYVVNSNLYKTNGSNGQEFPEASINIRVPAEKLNDVIAQIKALVKDPKQDVLAESVSGQDVTKEYTDLRSRQKNLEEAEKQLREIMAGAKKTEDVLAVYNQLTQIREQIEVIKGQIQYYQESAQLSSISVTIQSEAAVQPLEVAGWKPDGVARDAAQALINTGQWLGSVAIWLVIYVLPVGLVIFIPIRLIWYFVRRSQNKRKAQTPPPPTAPQVS